MMTVLARHWRCPECGFEQHTPLPASGAVHYPCHGGGRWTKPRSSVLRPIDGVLSAPTGTPVQLGLEVTA